MLFLVIERFRHGDAVPVYCRFREQGRLAPEGLDYVNSWVSTDLTTCYQVMQSDSHALLEQWMQSWRDLVDFEVVEVITSAAALAAITPRL
jgi:hypothetical protein